MVSVSDGAPILIVGAILSTLNVVDAPGAGAVLPARSLAVPAAIDMPRLPLPVIPDIVTVRVKPEPVTFTMLAVAEPVVFKVTLPFANVLLLKLASA